MARTMRIIFLCAGVVSLMSGCYYYPSGTYLPTPEAYQYDAAAPDLYVYP